MDDSKSPLGNLAILASFISASFLYIYVWSAASISNPLVALERQISSNNCPRSSDTYKISFPIEELELALEKASLPNKTVIIAVVNKAYVERTLELDTTMLDLFLESFWLGEDTRPLLDHLLIVAVDQTAYDRCMFKRLNCYKLETGGVNYAGEQLFMSNDFVKMMWRRTLLLLDVLKHGYSFIFTDVDVMWLRNPFSRLSMYETEDLQISTDLFNGDPRNETNKINTGFYYIRSNNKTISLFEKWYAMKDSSSGKKEQDVLAELLQNGTFSELGINARFWDTRYFSGFCKDSDDIRAVTTVHANCCRSIVAKVKDLSTVLRDWLRFKAFKARYPGRVASNRTLPFRWTGHFGCWHSWDQPPRNKTNNS